MRTLNFIAVVLAALPVVTAQIDGLAACASQCYGDLVAKGASIGCPGGDNACLCNSQTFRDGIDACVTQLCPSEGQDPVTQLNTVRSFCTAFQTQAPEATPAPTPAPTDAPAEAPSPSAAPPAETPIESPVDPVSTADPTSPSPSPSPAGESPSATPTSPGSATATDSSASSTGSSPAETNTAASDSQDNSSGDGGDSSSGLSDSAKIGIGVGVGAGAFVALLVLFIILCLRRRPKGRKISEPLPGSGRNYPSGPPRIPPTFTEKNLSELEMNARRYEDMLPRQQPRQMV